MRRPAEKCLEETVSTLKFAQRAKLVRNSAKLNEEMLGSAAELQVCGAIRRKGNLYCCLCMQPEAALASRVRAHGLWCPSTLLMA